MTYGGESNAKKIARAIFWEGLAERARLDGVTSPRCVVLSGPGGCDVRAARAVGFDDVVAVDTDAAALASAKSLLGDAAEWRRADFIEVVANERFDVVFMDACSPILALAAKVLPALVAAAGAPRMAAGRRWSACAFAVGGMYGRDGAYMVGDQDGEPDHRRMVGVLEKVTEDAAKVRGMFIPRTAISYLSRRQCGDKTPQTPMLYVYGLLMKTEDPAEYAWSGRSARRRWEAISRRVANDQRRAAGPPRCFRVGHDLDGVKVRAAALGYLDLGFDTRKVSDLLCIDRGTVSAWAAHRTMGTYAAG